MTRNQLKIIACLTMLIDHIGYLLLPEVIVLRYIGRISMPIFAFFIAEGCRYTRSRLRYFLQILILAVLCQSVYIAESLINGGIDEILLNILFTFSLSILILWAYLEFVKSYEEYAENGRWMRPLITAVLFCAAIALALFVCIRLEDLFDISITVDYGIAGVILPFFAVISPQKERQLPAYTIGLLYSTFFYVGRFRISGTRYLRFRCYSYTTKRRASSH